MATFLIVVLAITVIGAAFFFGTKKKARQQFGELTYDFKKEQASILAKLTGKQEDDKPARRWPVEANDLIESLEGLPHHQSRIFGRVMKRISPTRVMALFEGASKPVRRRISRLTMVRKAVPMTS